MKSLTDEQLNIAIDAQIMETHLTDQQLNEEICQWRGYEKATIPRYIGAESGDVMTWWFAPGIERVAPNALVQDSWLPSHITGIEALGNMHEAERGLTEYAQQLDFVKWLFHTADGNLWKKTHATARQRAIALLRVVKPEIFG